MAERNWHPIDKAPKGIGPLLLRAGPASMDPSYVGYQDPDNGRWFTDPVHEVYPSHFCAIPQFDAEDDGAAA